MCKSLAINKVGRKSLCTVLILFFREKLFPGEFKSIRFQKPIYYVYLMSFIHKYQSKRERSLTYPNISKYIHNPKVLTK